MNSWNESVYHVGIMERIKKGTYFISQKYVFDTNNFIEKIKKKKTVQTDPLFYTKPT
jgi:hypothetical protein